LTAQRGGVITLISHRLVGQSNITSIFGSLCHLYQVRLGSDMSHQVRPDVTRNL